MHADARQEGAAGTAVTVTLLARGGPWSDTRARMLDMATGDVKGRDGKAAVYVFNAGEDVEQVQKEAYAMFASENGLGPAAFPAWCGTLLCAACSSRVVSCGRCFGRLFCVRCFVPLAARCLCGCCCSPAAVVAWYSFLCWVFGCLPPLRI